MEQRSYGKRMVTLKATAQSGSWNSRPCWLELARMTTIQLQVKWYPSFEILVSRSKTLLLYAICVIKRRLSQLVIFDTDMFHMTGWEKKNIYFFLITALFFIADSLKVIFKSYTSFSEVNLNRNRAIPLRAKTWLKQKNNYQSLHVQCKKLFLILVPIALFALF